MEMEKGLIDATLGGNVYKKRVALGGKGKRGGARTIVATRSAGHWFFLHVFAKNEAENISKAHLLTLQITAEDLVCLQDPSVTALVELGELYEVIR